MVIVLVHLLNVFDWFINVFLEIECGGAGVLRAIKFVWQLLNIVCILIPIGLILMVIFDFAKNVVAGKEDEMKKNVNIAIKRIILCLAIFFVEPLVHFTVNLAGENDENFANCINIAVEGDLSQYEIEFNEDDYKIVTPPNNNTKDKLNATIKDSEVTNDDSNKSSNSSNIAEQGEGLWVAHQKNSADAVDNAIKEGFWGIEVDVYQSGDSGDTFRLYHDSDKSDYVGYDLDVFLDTCKEKNITAVLDLKSISSYDKLIAVVKDKKMEENTIYQTSIGGAKNIHKKDNNARTWVLISDSLNDISEEKKNELNSAKDSIEGINMRADHVDESDIKAIQDIGLTFCAFSYTSKLYSNADANKLREWGSNYIMANNIDEEE